MVKDSGLNPESSVCATKVLCEIGRDLEIDISPLTVEATVYNEPFAQHIAESGLNPSHKIVERLGEEGGRYVVLGARTKKKDEESDDWSGHLVAVLRAKKKPPTVVDLTIQQATRATYGIVIKDPLVFTAPAGFLNGSSVSLGQMFTSGGQVCFVYRALPLDTGFRNTVDWLRDYEARAAKKIDLGDLPEKTPEEPSVGPGPCPTGPAGGGAKKGKDQP
jgi:hypothetical protein